MNSDRTLHALRALLAFALLCIAWPFAGAQDRPLRIVVGSTPGGLPDLMAGGARFTLRLPVETQAEVPE